MFSVVVSCSFTLAGVFFLIIMFVIFSYCIKAPSNVMKVMFKISISNSLHGNISIKIKETGGKKPLINRVASFPAVSI